jgi:hypothetical protein
MRKLSLTPSVNLVARGIFFCSVASVFRPFSHEVTVPHVLSCSTFQFSAHARVLKLLKEVKIRACCHKLFSRTSHPSIANCTVWLFEKSWCSWYDGSEYYYYYHYYHHCHYYYYVTLFFLFSVDCQNLMVYQKLFLTPAYFRKSAGNLTCLELSAVWINDWWR